ncbi:MAG: hypothetical protein QX197_07570 [Methylococcaceae bacterium]
MKKNNLTLGVLAVLLLNSTLALAESDYPAADFQPKVLFSDNTANDDAKKAQPAPKAAVALKQTSAAVAAPASVAKTNTAPQLTTEVKSEESGSTSLIGLLLLAAAGGFLFFKKQGGLVCPRKTTSGTSAGTTVTYGKDASGLSGVARYVKNIELLSASGVTRYLAQKEVVEQEKAAESTVATGVEKYLKNRA